MLQLAISINNQIKFFCTAQNDGTQSSYGDNSTLAGYNVEVWTKETDQPRLVASFRIDGFDRMLGAERLGFEILKRYLGKGGG